MRLIAALALLATFASAPAAAQPGADPAPDYPGAEPPAPIQQPIQQPVQQPVQVQPRTIEMSLEERELILRGEIEPGLFLAGGLVGTFLAPFGIGQAIQGRWSDRGWVFTLGETASIGLIITGAVRLDQTNNGEGVLVAGIIGLIGFRVWEIIDLWVGPALHNQRVRNVYRKYGIGPHTPIYGARPFVLPTNGGGVGGLTLQF